MVFIFQFVNVVYHIDWFVNTEESLHPWNKTHLVMMKNTLIFKTDKEKQFLEITEYTWHQN